MSLFTDYLQRFMRERTVVDVYRERLCKHGLMGRVVGLSERVLLLDRIDDRCEPDGLTAIRPSDITRVRAQDRELLAVEQLVCARNDALNLDEIALLELSSAMTILHRRYGAVTVHVEALDSTLAFSGEPIELDDDVLVLRQWGTKRTLDKYILLLRLDEITRVDSDTRYLRCLSAAHALPKL